MHTKQLEDNDEIHLPSDSEEKRLSPGVITVPSSIPPPLSTWIVDSSRDTPSILIPPICTSLQTSSSPISTIRPIPIFATSSLSPASLTTHSSPAGMLPLVSNPPPIRPIPTSQLTTALQQQLLPNSYLHGVYTQQGNISNITSILLP